METKMKADVLAKKLRTRLAQLKKDRVSLLKKHEAQFVAWQKSLSTWIKTNGPDRVSRITKSECEANENRHRAEPGFATDRFFEGAPTPPRYPSDEAIREVQRRLRYIAITGQSTISLSLSDANKMFGEGEDE